MEGTSGRAHGIDVKALRHDTPGCSRVAHLNNAGAALMPKPVLDAMTDYLRLESEIGGYEAEYRSPGRIAGTRASIAALIGGHEPDVALLDSATRAWDIALGALPLSSGDRILTSPLEYVSNWIALRQLAVRTGCVIEVVPNGADGSVDLEAMASTLDERVRLVTLTHIPTHRGVVSPAAEVGRLARSVGAFYLLDACQSVGQIQVDVRAIGCHLLAGTGRKYLRGPRGTGFLWVDPGIGSHLFPASLDIAGADVHPGGEVSAHSGARRFELWEGNRGAQIALGVAINLVRELGIESIAARIAELAPRLRHALSSVGGVTVHDAADSPSGIVTFSIAGLDPHAVRDAAWAKDINVSISSGENEMLTQPELRVGDVVRASVHCYNTEEECDRFVDLVRHLAAD